MNRQDMCQETYTNRLHRSFVSSEDNDVKSSNDPKTRMMNERPPQGQPEGVNERRSTDSDDGMTLSAM